MKLQFLRRDFLLGFLLTLHCARAAAPAISIQVNPDHSLSLEWTGDSAEYALEQSTALNPGTVWLNVLEPVTPSGDRLTVRIPVSDETRFFRLHQINSPVLTIASRSPDVGEVGVAVTRESIFRLSQALAPDTLLDTDRLHAIAGGRRMLSRAELSTDRKTVTLFFLENLPADSRVEVSFDGTGLFDDQNRPVDLDGDGVVGGVARHVFETVSVTALSTTGVEGYVYASEKNPDGSEHPLNNVTITVDGMEETLRTTTDTNGFFRLVPSPAGRFFVSVDGRTADGSVWPGGAYYPFVGKAWEATPGRTNNPAGGSGTVYLPLIQADALKTVNAGSETRIGFAPSVVAQNPTLAGVEIAVPPNALFSDNGTRGGKVGIAPVAFDRLPEPLPPGLNFPLVITVQTDGARNFDQPVPVRFPNLPDPVTGKKLNPGDKTALWSFNHDTGRWEIQGSMTISADGKFAVSDPGVGVRQPGWHGTNPGGSGGGPEPSPFPDTDDNDDDGDGDDDDCMKVVTCRIKPKGGNAASCLLRCVGDFFSKERKKSPAELGLCAGNRLLCPGNYDNVLTENERSCMDNCLFPDPENVFFTIPCKEEITCSELDPLGNVASSGRGGVARPASGFAGLPPDRLVEQRRLWHVQAEYLRRVAGTSKIVQTSSEDLPWIDTLVAAFDERTTADSPSGIHLSPQERQDLLALTRPAQFNAVEWAALIDRLDSLQGIALPPDIQKARQELESLILELKARGWKTPLDGLRQGLVQRSRALAPLPGSPEFPIGPHYYRIINLDTGFELAGQLNAAGRFDGVILAPNNLHAVFYLDPKTGNAGAAFFRSRASGRTTPIPTAPLEPVTADETDTDQDQLSDLVEGILGTNPNAADTDGDGLSDGVEFAAGTNPSDGQPLSLGVLATRETPGVAVDVDTANDFAIVADSSSGLAVFDVSNPTEPVLRSQFAPANVFFDAVATAGEFVAAVPVSNVANQAGVQLFRLPSDGTLKPVKVLPLGVVPRTVAAAGRYAYVPARSGNAATLAVVKLSLGVLHRHVPIAGGLAVTGLVIDGDILWAIAKTTLLSFRISGDDLLPLGTLALGNLAASANEPGLELTAGNGRVYIGGLNGFQVIDGSDPSVPTLLAAVSSAQAAMNDFALNGTGLLLPAITIGGVSSHFLSVYDIRNDQPTNFLTSFDTPGSARAVVLHRGYALVADQESGLAVVSYLPADRGTNPPTLSLQPWISHPPTGQESDENFHVSAITTDDVQVRDVAYYVDGVLTARSGKYPFDITLRAPALTAGKSSMTLRARATDTGGNTAWSPELTIALLPDLTPPRLIEVVPASGSTVPRGSVSALSATFDSTMELTRLNQGWTLSSAGADGALGTADDVLIPGGNIAFNASERTASRRFAAPLLSGKYRAQMAASVQDLGGNALGTNITWDFTIPPAKPVESILPDKAVALPGTVNQIEVRFDERLIPGTVTPSSILLTTTNSPTPSVIAGGVASLSADGRGAVLTFPQPIENGVYRVVVTSDIRDVYGSPVSTNFPVQWRIKGPTTWAQDTGGLWQTGTNWTGGAIPILNDHVVIDRPNADPVIQLRTAATVTTLRSEEAFVIPTFLGELTVLDRAVFNASLSLESASTTPLTAKFLEVYGSALLNSPLKIGEDAHFFGPVTATAGDMSYVGGRSHFHNRFDTTRNGSLGSHILTVESGAIARFQDNQLMLNGTTSRLRTAPGGRLELVQSSTAVDRISFWYSQGATPGRIENGGEFIKQGAGTSEVKVGLLNTGNLVVEQGVLRMGTQEGPYENQGITRVAANARMELNGSFTQSPEGRFLGEGTVKLKESAVLNGSYEVTGVTEFDGSLNNNSTNFGFHAPIRSTGTWILKSGRARFDGATTELLGPVILQGGKLMLSSPGETRVPDLRLEKASSLGGSGRLVLSGDRRLGFELSIEDSLQVRFEGPVTIAARLSVGRFASMELGMNSRWTNGSSISGNLRTLPGVVLEMVNEAPASPTGLTIPFPQEGILRKTGVGTLMVSSDSSQVVTNRSLIDVVAGTFSVEPSTVGIFRQEAGEVRLSGGATFSAPNLVIAGGDITGTGSIESRRTSNWPLAATVSPGQPYGKISFINRSPSWASGSRLLIDIGGTNPGVDHDQMTVAGAFRTSNTALEVRTAAGFEPSVGQEFTVVTAGLVNGTFPTVTGLELGNGRRYQVVYEETAIKLRVVAP